MSALRVPGGNQVDGLPPARHTKTVAKRQSREPRTQMHLTMKIMFLNVIASRKCLGITIVILRKVLKFIEILSKCEHDFEILVFYRV